jgi:hypothetical protein
MVLGIDPCPILHSWIFPGGNLDAVKLLLERGETPWTKGFLHQQGL